MIAIGRVGTEGATSVEDDEHEHDRFAHGDQEAVSKPARAGAGVAGTPLLVTEADHR
jgi:hypothetical protein